MNLGFQFVPFPKEIWEMSIDLSQAEFRLLGWFLYGLKFGISQLKVTDDHLLKGFTHEEGRKYPPLGLSRNAMHKARGLLIERNILIAEQVEGGGGRGKSSTWIYSINLSDNDKIKSKTSHDVTIYPSDSDKFKGSPIVERASARIKELREEQTLSSNDGDEGWEIPEEPKVKTDGNGIPSERRKEFMAILKYVWDQKNPKVKFPCDDKDGKAATRFLKAYREVDIGLIADWATNMIQSDDFNGASRPFQYLDRLNTWANGEHDKYGKLRPKNF